MEAEQWKFLKPKKKKKKASDQKHYNGKEECFHGLTCTLDAE